MYEILDTTASLMSLVSMVLLVIGSITALRRSKIFYFVIGEFAFVTTITFGCLAVIDGNWSSTIWLWLWFMLASITFGVATFLTTK